MRPHSVLLKLKCAALNLYLNRLCAPLQHFVYIHVRSNGFGISQMCVYIADKIIGLCVV